MGRGTAACTMVAGACMAGGSGAGALSRVDLVGGNLREERLPTSMAQPHAMRTGRPWQRQTRHQETAAPTRRPPARPGSPPAPGPSVPPPVCLSVSCGTRAVARPAARLACTGTMAHASQQLARPPLTWVAQVKCTGAAPRRNWSQAFQSCLVLKRRKGHRQQKKKNLAAISHHHR